MKLARQLLPEQVSPIHEAAALRFAQVALRIEQRVRKNSVTIGCQRKSCRSAETPDWNRSLLFWHGWTG